MTNEVEIKEVDTTPTTREAKSGNVKTKGGHYKSTIENQILIGRYKIAGGDTFNFDKDVLSDDNVKARFARAVEIGLLVSV